MCYLNHCENRYFNITFVFQGPPPRPSCNQVYNLFHPTNPCASRIEPLLSARFAQLAPINIPRYQKYPLGDGQSLHLCKSLLKHFVCNHFKNIRNNVRLRLIKVNILETKSISIVSIVKFSILLLFLGAYMLKSVVSAL